MAQVEVIAVLVDRDRACETLHALSDNGLVDLLTEAVSHLSHLYWWPPVPSAPG